MNTENKSNSYETPDGISMDKTSVVITSNSNGEKIKSYVENGILKTEIISRDEALKILRDRFSNTLSRRASNATLTQ
jgi:hypothetical protein